MEKSALITAWKADRKENLRVRVHTHSYHELVYYLSGGGVTTIAGEAYPFAAGDFAVLPPETPHDEQHDRDGALICIGFTGVSGLQRGVRHDGDCRILSLMTAILEEATVGAVDAEQLLAAQVTMLGIYLKRAQQPLTARHTPPDFRYAIRYLRDNFHERIVLSDIAAQLHFSYDYFQHRFKVLTGLSPQQYLMRVRLDTAEKLLRESTLSSTEIAYRCGFGNTAAFCAALRRDTGMTPLQYRAK